MGPLKLRTLGLLLLVWYGLVGGGGGCQITIEFICKGISMLFQSEKFYGGGGGVGGIAIIESSSRSRSLRDLR